MYKKLRKSNVSNAYSKFLQWFIYKIRFLSFNKSKKKILGVKFQYGRPNLQTPPLPCVRLCPNVPDPLPSLVRRTQFVNATLVIALNSLENGWHQTVVQQTPSNIAIQIRVRQNVVEVSSWQHHPQRAIWKTYEQQSSRVYEFFYTEYAHTRTKIAECGRMGKRQNFWPKRRNFTVHNALNKSRCFHSFLRSKTGRVLQMKECFKHPD